MGRILPVLLGVLLASPLAAELVADFQDDVFLRDHETVRYEIELDYGTATEAEVDVLVRGFISPPRVRVLNASRKEIKDVSDTDGDWTVNPSFTAREDNAKYYVEVDSASPGSEGDFEVTIRVEAEDGAGADAQVSFAKFFFDYESGDASDHYDCSTGTASGLLVLLALGLIGAVALHRRTA